MDGETTPSARPVFSQLNHCENSDTRLVLIKKVGLIRRAFDFLDLLVNRAIHGGVDLSGTSSFGPLETAFVGSSAARASPARSNK